MFILPFGMDSWQQSGPFPGPNSLRIHKDVGIHLIVLVFAMHAWGSHTTIDNYLSNVIAFSNLCLSTRSQSLSIGDLYVWCFLRDYTWFLHMNKACFFHDQASSHRVERGRKAVTINNWMEVAIAFRSYYGWQSNYHVLDERHKTWKVPTLAML